MAVSEILTEVNPVRGSKSLNFTQCLEIMELEPVPLFSDLMLNIPPKTLSFFSRVTYSLHY